MKLRMKKTLLLIAVVITILAIPISVYLVGQNQELRKRAAPASTLTLTPTTVTTKVNETFTQEVKLDAADNQVATIQIHVLYDPTKLTTESITNGPLAPSIRVSGNVNPNGVASITVGARDSTHPITGSGTVAVLTMRALTASSTPISLRFAPNPDTYANALGEGENNVIIGMTSANVTILNADGTQAQADPTVGNTTNSNNSVSTQSASLISATLTPTPTIMMQNSASQSAEATASAIEITSITANETVTTAQPPIEGKGVPGSTVTLIIHSTPQTVTVTVDGNGNWTYTPTTPLEPGTHTVEAMVTDPNTGQTQTTTTSFVIANPGTGGTSDSSATGSAVPVTGAVENTFILTALGVLILVSGALVPFLIQ
jgi:hypothetical protein